MLRSIAYSVAALMLPAILFAQQHTKTKEKSAREDIDYKVAGAPMPPLAFMRYSDSTEVQNGKKKHKKHRKHTEANEDSALRNYTLMTDKELRNGANLLVMMFNPTCSHCEEMTFTLEKNKNLFHQSKIVLLATPVMNIYVPDYAQRHHVDQLPFMYIGFDSSGFVDKTFLYQSLPQINIYGKDRTLIRTFTGDVPIDSLSRYID